MNHATYSKLLLYFLLYYHRLTINCAKNSACNDGKSSKARTLGTAIMVIYDRTF